MKAFLKSLLVGLIITFLLTNKYGNDWEMDLRLMAYDLKGDSIPDYAAEILGEDGVPMVLYAEENGIRPGLQYNATIVANYALKYAEKCTLGNEVDCRKFKNTSASLIENIHIDSNGAKFLFDWQQAWYPQVPAPFTSGMTSGLALQVFGFAFEKYRDSSYYFAAKQLVKGFYQNIDSGGFTLKGSDGWWYEEIAAPGVETPKILDGHIFALQGLMDYQSIFGGDSVNFLIGSGMEALQYNLPAYDLGNGAFAYDVFLKPADIKYRKIILDQLKDLYSATGHQWINDWYQKWVEPDARPFIIRVIRDEKAAGITLFVLLTVVFTIFSWFCMYRIPVMLNQFKQKMGSLWRD